MTNKQIAAGRVAEILRDRGMPATDAIVDDILEAAILSPHPPTVPHEAPTLTVREVKQRCIDKLSDLIAEFGVEHALTCYGESLLGQSVDPDGHPLYQRRDYPVTYDGVDIERRTPFDERSAVVAFVRDLVDKERRGGGLVVSPAVTQGQHTHAASVLSLVADNIEIGAHTSGDPP
jgi:hypothetical protein